MDPLIRTLEKIVEIRQSVLNISDELKHLQNELDFQVSELVEVLKHRRIVETTS